MNISIVNQSLLIGDDALQRVVRAINRQVQEDYASHWGRCATLRLEGNAGKGPDKLRAAELRGDAVMYLWDKVDVADALGYHELNARGIPFGFVFTELSHQLAEDWTVTLSHEILELLGDPQANLVVAGPHPHEKRTVYYWYEMCDAVQDETYEIDGVQVSNFVLPLYFTRDAEPGSRNDFLGRKHHEHTLPSFGVNPGGYVGYFDPKAHRDITIARAGDERAALRLQAKKSRSTGRGMLRSGKWPREPGGQHQANRYQEIA